MWTDVVQHVNNMEKAAPVQLKRHLHRLFLIKCQLENDEDNGVNLAPRHCPSCCSWKWGFAVAAVGTSEPSEQVSTLCMAPRIVKTLRWYTVFELLWYHPCKKATVKSPKPFQQLKPGSKPGFQLHHENHGFKPQYESFLFRVCIFFLGLHGFPPTAQFLPRSKSIMLDYLETMNCPDQ